MTPIANKGKPLLMERFGCGTARTIEEHTRRAWRRENIGDNIYQRILLYLCAQRSLVKVIKPGQVEATLPAPTNSGKPVFSDLMFITMLAKMSA